jgi:Sulfotransferase family
VSEINGQPSNPVFVVGVFRSGTSLLYSLLNQHPQIALMYECDVWDFPNMAGRRRFSGDWLERQEFYNQALSRHRLIFGGKMRGLENIRTPDDLYRCHGHSKDARLWGEKSPVYAARLAQLARQYPHGSFILIWRDPVEVYRSILVAGKKTPFFRRPGMLHRLIYHKEKMIREAGQLQRARARIHHISYDDLVDRTETTCRATCDFLGVSFHEEMLKLERADFSAIYREPQHDFLRRGVIERQNYSDGKVAPTDAAKLRRFRSRWERLSGQRLGTTRQTTAEPEASAVERLYHCIAGDFFFTAENIKRLGFEFLPLPWLRTYRLFKSWLFSHNDPSNRVSIKEQTHQHGITILASFLLWALIVGLDNLTSPEITIGPLYLIPCATLALVVGYRWASVAALLNAIAITFLRFNEGRAAGHFNFSMDAVLAWNVFMRFVFFEVFVLLLDRIRVEFTARNSAVNNSLPEELPKG